MASTNSNSNSLTEKPGNSEAARPVRAKKVKIVDQRDHENIQWSKKKKKNGFNATDNSLSLASSVPIAPMCSSPQVVVSSALTKGKKPPVDLNVGTAFYQTPFKRPRGRPPLPSNRYKTSTTNDKIDMYNGTSSSFASSSAITPKYALLKGRVAGPYKSKNFYKTNKTSINNRLHPSNTNNYSSERISSSSSLNGNSHDSRQYGIIDQKTQLKMCHFDPISMSNSNKTTSHTRPNVNNPQSSSSKQSRPPAGLIVNKILSVLMTSDPLSITEINSRIPEAPKDMIQAVLDVLRVLGLVVQLKWKDSGPSPSPKAHSGNASSSGSLLSGTVYSLTEFAKSPTALEDITKLEEDIATRLKEIREISERNDSLQALVSSEMTPQERVKALSELLSRHTLRCPRLQSDPLYQTLHCCSASNATVNISDENVEGNAAVDSTVDDSKDAVLGDIDGHTDNNNNVLNNATNSNPESNAVTNATTNTTFSSSIGYDKSDHHHS